MPVRFTVSNKITTPETIAQINPENKILMDDFLDYLLSIDRAKSTISQYRSDLHIFFVWDLQNNNNKEFSKLTKREIARFQSHAMNEWGWSPKRTRRVKATLSSLSNYIENVLDEEEQYEGYRSIIKKIENPPDEPVRDKTVFTEEELQPLLDKLVADGEYQKACALALGIASGRRKSELCRFKVSYFDEENIIFNALYKTPEKIKTKGHGSRGKLLTCYVLVKKFKPYFDLWMKQREELGIKSEWLLLKRIGNTYIDEPMEFTTLDSYADTFNVFLDKPFYWHSLRHMFVTDLAQANLPDSIIQNILGWTSADMVRIYDDREIDEELGKYFDENGIKNIETTSFSNL